MMMKVLVGFLLCCKGAGKPKVGSSTQNVHVSFGDVDSCVAPACADFIITEAQVLASLVGFTTHNGGTIATPNINYYGSWWNTNVGTDVDVASDFCTAGAGASQSATSQSFGGVTYTAGVDEYTLVSYSTPNHDCEDYCSAAGGKTPPLLESTFTTSHTHSMSMTPASKSRADVQTGTIAVAVNGVAIFNSFTGISSVAAYDETLATCNGHPANGLYHYHGFTTCLHGETAVQTGSSIPHSKIYGWAYDGFPIYGPYGYSDSSDSSSPVARVTAGYACTSSGAACSTDTEKAVAANWAYSSSNGMLDDCNGRWTKTPEFPDGMYVYVLNIDADGKIEFPGVPYCTQSTVTGTVGVDVTTSLASTSGCGSTILGLHSTSLASCVLLSIFWMWM